MASCCKARCAAAYDLVVHLTEHPRGAWLVRLLRAALQRRAAARRRGHRFWRKSFTHLFSQAANARRHTVERNLDALRRIGVYPATDERRLTLVPGAPPRPASTRCWRSKACAANELHPLHPASRWLFKCWPEERNAELIRALHAARRADRCSPPRRTRGRLEMVARILGARPGAAIDLAGQLSLKETGGPECPREAVRRRRLGADAHRGRHGHADAWRCSALPANWSGDPGRCRTGSSQRRAPVPALRHRRLRRRQDVGVPDDAAVDARAGAQSTNWRRGRASLKLALVRQKYNPYGGAERFVERALARSQDSR